MKKVKKMKKELLFILFVVLLVSACAPVQKEPTKNDSKTIVVEQEEETPIIPTVIPTREETMKKNAEASGYVGKPLAGDTSFYIEFNIPDYNFALATDKLILLNFYSTECAYCQNDNDAAISAFDSMNYPDVVGFRVLFNDPASTLEDKNIALKYGVENLNTKIIIKGGKKVFKATDTWNKQTFIDEINRNRG